MELIGHIEAGDGHPPIDKDRWVDLVQSHPSLRPVPPVLGINPFTRMPCEFIAPTSTAKVIERGLDCGMIFWAEDESACLVVEANDSERESVVAIACGIAQQLGGRLVSLPI
jgi:hypothetical protein